MVKSFNTEQKLKNQSYHFLLPLLEIRSHLGIIDTFLGDVNEDVFNNKLYILCESQNTHIENNENIIKSYEVEEGLMYVLNIPQKFDNEYINFLKGKYSKYSEESKEILCLKACKNSNKEPYETQVYAILYKTKARRDSIEEKLNVKLDEEAELASIFNEKLEIYGY